MGAPGSSTEEVAATPRQGWGAFKGPSDATIPSLRGAGWQPCPAPRSHLPLSSQFPRPVPAPSSQLPAPPCPPLARLSPQPRAPLPARCRRSPAGPSRAGRRWRSYRRIRTRGGGRSSSRPRSAPWRRAPGTRGCAEYEANALACTEKLSRILLDGSYRPGAFHTFYVFEPKKRLVQAPAFVDKVVLHALVDNELYSVLTHSFIDRKSVV